MLQGLIDWLKGALSAVYSKDGLVGVGVVVGLVLLVLVVLVGVVWFTGVDVLGLFGQLG